MTIFFAQHFVLQTFVHLLRMKINEFCAVFRHFFAQFVQNRKYYILRKIDEN